MLTHEIRSVLERLLAEATTSKEKLASERDVVAELLNGARWEAKLRDDDLSHRRAAVGLEVEGRTDGSASGSLTSTVQQVLEEATRLSRQLEQLRASGEAQTEKLEANTAAVLQNSLELARGRTGSMLGGAAKTAAALTGGFGLAPLISGLARLFSRGGSEPVSSLERYTLPPSIHLEAGLTNSPQPRLQAIRYEQDGLPRVVSAGPSAPLPPVTIQVQAVDSRSFMDHSEAIARAVREAMLNSHPLNDVVLEL